MKNNEEEYTKEFENIFHRHFNADKMLPEGFLTRTRGRIPDEYKKILSPFLRKEVQFSTKLVLDDEGCERKYPYFTITYRGIQQKFIAMYFTYERKFKYELWANIFKVKTEEDQIDFSKQLLKTKRFYCYLHKDAPLNAEDMQLYFKYDFKWREKSILKKMISESEYEAFQRISTELREDGNILNYGVVENEFVKFSMEGKINFDPETGKIVGFGKITINEKHITELVLGGFFGSYNSLHNTEFGMIEGVKINHIPESLGRLTHLRQLDLSYNSITKLPTSFGNLCKLQNLNLSHNQIEQFPEVLTRLPDLEFLEITYNRLKELPITVKKLKNPDCFHFEKNRITSLSEELKEFFEVEKKVDYEWLLFWEKITLNNSEKVFLADLAVELNIEYVYEKCLTIENNHITEFTLENEDYGENWVIPESIGNVKQLISLVIKGGVITALPFTIGKLNQLEVLKLPHNLIKTLPDSIGNLKNLKVLDLKANQLVYLPDRIGDLNSLIELDLRENSLVELPETIRNLSSLEVLRLNSIRYPGSGGLIAEDMAMVHDLAATGIDADIAYSIAMIDSNHISELSDAIGQLKSLKELYLGGNWLHELPESIGNLISLEILDITRNFLSPNEDLIIIPETVNKLSHLQKIYIGGWFNSIFNVKHIPPYLQTWLVHLEATGCTISRDFWPVEIYPEISPE